MGYEVAVNKAWDELSSFKGASFTSVRFLADNYSIDPRARSIISLSCNVPAKEFTAIILLHYLIQKAKGLPRPTGQWLNFRELSGIEGYYPAFRRRCIEPLIRKFGRNPSGLFLALERFSSRKAEGADAAIIVELLEGVPAMVKLWGADEEFGAEANILFDRSITHIFCTEDIVILAQMLAAGL